jgi:phosphoribosylformylglycinamidine synthase
MAFAGHTGLDLQLPGETEFDAFAPLFAEELGALLQVRNRDLEAIQQTFHNLGLSALVSPIGSLNDEHVLRIHQAGHVLYEQPLPALREAWSDLTRQMARMRDNPECAEQEFSAKLDPFDPGIQPEVPFEIWVGEDFSIRPPMAILREQGVNGEVEMAAAFTRAGFRAIDVHMTDILSGRISLRDFRGLVACGGFSYGDVLGAGEGWAKSILFNPTARAEFAAFFERKDTFALGVCNGCQMMSNLQSIIPGAERWPRFVQNQSERFEARFSTLRIEKSPSLLFAGMEGARLPIAVAHGEGFAEFADPLHSRNFSESGLVAARYVDHYGEVTERYPLNPNGSPFGITALTNQDGRVTLMMPHPERVFRTVQHSWAPKSWGEDAPWLRLFRNARVWVG